MQPIQLLWRTACQRACFLQLTTELAYYTCSLTASIWPIFCKLVQTDPKAAALEGGGGGGGGGEENEVLG